MFIPPSFYTTDRMKENNGMQALKEGIAELSGMEEGSTEEKIQALCREKKLYIFMERTARPEIMPSH